MKKIIFTGLSLFFLTGCSFIRTVPAKYEYNLKIKTTKYNYLPTACKKNVIKISILNNNTLINSNLMYYKIGSYKIDNYTQSKWLQMPSFMINLALIKMLRADNIFKAVISKDSFANANFMLEVNIENFMQYFTKTQRNSFVKVKMYFTLINLKTDNIITSQTQISRLKVNQLNAFGGVVMLSKAVSNILNNNSLWLQNICIKR